MFQIDYFERAKRLEEIPLIKKAYEEQRIKDMELWELQEEERVTPYSPSPPSAQSKKLLCCERSSDKYLHTRNNILGKVCLAKKS